MCSRLLGAEFHVKANMMVGITLKGLYLGSVGTRSDNIREWECHNVFN